MEHQKTYPLKNPPDTDTGIDADVYQLKTAVYPCFTPFHQKQIKA